MKILLILLSLQTGFSQEPQPDTEIWRVGNLHYPFLKDKKTNALFSTNCLKNKNVCEAFQAVLKKNAIALKESDRSGGKNPGAVVCKKSYGGDVLILRDAAGNENAFCKFKDKSITSVSDLY